MLTHRGSYFAFFNKSLTPYSPLPNLLFSLCWIFFFPLCLIHCSTFLAFLFKIIGLLLCWGWSFF
ncbi:unnamed protein product [Meloidogyne enterolobii]|uniref:Uncharacterized protein n=1 Tax=Meloidogyne enterolobii TaxID=390850 RepID=A0ACB1ALZ6_MELEN